MAESSELSEVISNLPRMDDNTWNALRATPLAEIRRRAAIVCGVAQIEPMVVDGAERFAWNDRSGQSAVWYFPPDGRALLLTFERESDLNLWDDEYYEAQESLYRGVPDDLMRLVRDQPDNYESGNVTDEGTGNTLHCAGGVFWFDGEQWRAAEGFTAHCEKEGLDAMRESGFDYCLEAYLFGQEFTAEALVEHWQTLDWREDTSPDRVLAAIREIFAWRA
jgi:hypothetical protein